MTITAVQRSFDDLGTPLVDVTFCIFDLETTGGSPTDCGITEIGAVKVRGGEVLGTFHTLVNPGGVIPPEITILTGITQAMVMTAPRIEAVLPMFLDFCADTVLVAHNARFDVGFINAACRRAQYPLLRNDVVDTVALARRLVRDEVPNCKLETLATRLRLDHRPSHRALDDALATCDLLHLLIERAASWGVMGLDDLLNLHRMAAHPQARKLRLTERLPRSPGVYLFKGPSGEPLYIGKATNLRQRVRSYFSSDDRRKIGGLLRETTAIDHIECTSTLEAAVLEVRLIHAHLPRYNRQATTFGQYRYVKLSVTERFPRLAVTKQAAGDGNLYLGPLPSAAHARLIIDAIESVTRLRRCSTRIGPRARRREALCTAAQLGVAMCPCTGELDEAAYATVVDDVVHGLTDEPHRLLDRLHGKMTDLASQARFEEAADVRNRAAALARTLDRMRRVDALRAAGAMSIEFDHGVGATVERGVLVATWSPATGPSLPKAIELPDIDGPVPCHLADELHCIDAWIAKHIGRLRLLAADGWALPRVPLFDFAPIG